MTELSPAAQAVLDAINKELYEAPVRWEPSYSAMVAIALRAAADQLGEELEFYNARVIDAEDLLAIAAELEAQ